MPISVVMPALEMAQETGKLVSWLKKEGETVRKGEMLLEIETDKAVMEIEAQAEGVLAGIAAREGDVIPVGQTIAWLLAPGDSAPPPQQPPAKTSEPQIAKSSVPSGAAVTNGSSVKISPKARRLAKEQGVDLASVKGSGPGGEILSEDILTAHGKAALGRSSTQPIAAAVIKPNQVGRVMAQRTAESWTTVPHFFLQREVVATALSAVREEIASQSGVRPSFTDMLVSLVARILKRHPRMNSSWKSGDIHANASINIGVAVAVDGGVVTPVIQNADDAALTDIAARSKELAQRARSGTLRPEDISGATFTITNLGMYDVDSFSAIIVSPQAGILAVGKLVDRVVVMDGKPSVAPVITLTLSADHRVTDGAQAAGFFKDLAQAISDPLPVLNS
jgi:pyruvate dehydrogenase E2 component (dihydrolipoamide acetyltransferase)